ncbi:CDP-alcohol phosphatidyltransferase family protein [Carnobacterium antarcticum]|uniref:CDP-diacylglycerol--glycerol-3-phosphate 3-phosphatidyltransferase n=1 Tax=Carnobacterium antarcticum TaxID=2126436 RepID=A0ABW4NR25_9LACT|nr:CDP-alcohol phosphatidyltransferase family protein [Carnobacterium sp. CS13]QQP71228.1 CDP-alcohol phosphatidyltransferase family protein [Carnobacterium sp. CS13]
MSSYNRRDWFTIPNILSYIRILLVPVFIFIYLNATETKHFQYAALIVVFSGLTDLLDGWIARKYNQITEIGKLLDPIADKITQAAIIFCLIFRYDYMWLLVLLFVVKELTMGICNVVLFKKGKKLDGAKWFGKISTAVFYGCMTGLVAFPMISDGTATLLMSVTGFFLFLSFILYAKVFTEMLRSVKK